MDRAERLIRDAKPAGEALSPRAEADLARILASETENPGSPAPSPHRPVRWAWAAAAALVIALLIAGFNLVRPGQAVAATPPVPTITPTGQNAAAVLHELQVRVAAQTDRSGDTEIVTQWWALGSDVDATGKITGSTIDPIKRVVTLGTHGVARYTDYAAQPYDAAGRPVNEPKSPAPGTQLGTVTVDADQQFFTDRPPTEPGDFGDYFTDHLPLNSPSATSRAFTGIGVLLNERILSPDQHAALLGYLGGLRDIEMLGTTTDRLGREALVFGAPIEKDNQVHLMISPDTGQITGTEIIYRGTDRTDIPSPAVVEYVAWEAP